MKNINFKNLRNAFLIIILYLIIVPQIVGLIFLPFVNIEDKNILTIINLIVYIIDVIIIFIIYHKSIKEEWIRYKNNFKNYFKIALKNWLKGFLLMILFNLTIINIVGSIAVNETQNREILNQLPIFSVIAMVFLGPILEEFAFRKGFKKAFKNKTVFLIVTSLLFGLAHVIGNLDYSSMSLFIGSLKELLYILPYGTLGYFFGKAYYETDCIFTSITSHMFHNGLTILVIFLGMMVG